MALDMFGAGRLVTNMEGSMLAAPLRANRTFQQSRYDNNKNNKNNSNSNNNNSNNNTALGICSTITEYYVEV